MPELDGRRPAGGGRRKQPTPDREGRPLGLTAVDVMIREVITVRRETTIHRVSELFQVHNINGVPVVDNQGGLIGIITEEDLVFGQMGFSDAELELLESNGPIPDGDVPGPRRVAELMTANPIYVKESTPVEEICRLIWRLKIHRLPVVRSGRVSGIVSSVDICRLVAEGRARLQRV